MAVSCPAVAEQPSAGCRSAGEILRPDLVEELSELLDLVLLLVRNDDGGLGKNLIRTADLGAHPQREGDRITGPGGHPQPLADNQLGVEDVVSHFDDLDGLQRRLERRENVPDQIMRQWPFRLDATSKQLVIGDVVDIFGDR